MIQITKEFDEGYRAAMEENASKNDNPYDYHSQRGLYARWVAGWKHGHYLRSKEAKNV